MKQGEGGSAGGKSDDVSTDPELCSRVNDLVRLAPTSNGELTDVWGLQTGKETWHYLHSELSECYERNTNDKIQPISKAHELVSERNSS